MPYLLSDVLKVAPWDNIESKFNEAAGFEWELVSMGDFHATHWVHLLNSKNLLTRLWYLD